MDIKEKEMKSIIAKESIDAHRLMVMWLFVATLTIGLAFMSWLIYVDRVKKGGPTILVVVIIAGSLGGFVSSLKRLYAFQDVFPRLEYIHLFKNTNFYVIAYSFVPAIVGMIGACLLYVIFAAGMLQGGLFPTFECEEAGNGCRDFNTFLSYWSPKGPAEYAKSIVWGFIAGFSERFVPDILNRFSNAESKKADRGNE